MGQWEAVPEHSTTSMLRAPTGPAWPLGLLHGRTPWQPPWPPAPHTVMLQQGRPQVPTVPAMGAAKPGPCSALSQWPSLAAALVPGQQIDFLAWARTCLITTRFPASWLELAPFCISVPLTFLCEPWAARHWHRELHSFWNPNCWIMGKVLTACEHLKFPSYLFHQNRSVIPWVVSVRFSLSGCILTSQITCWASVAETHLYGIHSLRKEDLLLF